MPEPPDFGLSETPQEELIIQRRLGQELRRSFQAMVDEPLPERMALLLMELAFAQSLRVRPTQENEAEGEKPTSGNAGEA
ncbi:MAG: NepR family anti-sigma factor [Methylocystis sp.]|uniref:NepR family anti-sigma factor n=1 Tax=Methylocystis sp. TaxID=1911079 RepID=UPI003DA3364B